MDRDDDAARGMSTRQLALFPWLLLTVLLSNVELSLP